MAERAQMRMLLVRHGQSRWNAMRRWQGQANSPLTAHGRQQARDAARAMRATPELTLYLSQRRITAIWASTLSRASQTAALIADELRIPHIRCDARLAETDAGPWQGLTRAEIEAGWPGYLDSQWRPNGFEPVDAVVNRVHAGLLDIASATAERDDPLAIAVVHSGVLRTMMRAAGAPLSGIPNLAGWFVDVSSEGVVPVGEFVPDVATAATQPSNGRSVRERLDEQTAPYPLSAPALG